MHFSYFVIFCTIRKNPTDNALLYMKLDLRNIISKMPHATFVFSHEQRALRSMVTLNAKFTNA